MKNRLILCPDDSTRCAFFEKEIEKLLKDAPLPQKANEKIYIIVPEQYTLETEKRFLARFGYRAMPYFKIVSFKHLSRIVFAETGNFGLKFIENGGKNALILKAVSSVSPFLHHYPPDYKPISFVKLVGKAITDMKLGGLLPEELEKASLLEQNDKLHDISLFASAYDALFDEGEFDANDRLSCLADVLKTTGFLSGAKIFCDRFCTFTHAEKQVIFALIETGASVCASLPTTALSVPEYSLFSEISRCALSLAAGAKKIGSDFEITAVPPEKHRTEALEELCADIYGDKESDTPPDGISVYKATDITAEVTRAAAIITKMVRDEGYRYGDFIVITRENEPYSSVLDPIFSKYNIPLFCHRRVPLKIKPLSRLVDALFSMVTDGFRREYVMGFLKTGLTDFSADDIALFEAYTDKWNLSYDRFRSEFTLAPDSAPETLERINAVRQKTVETADKFKTDMGEKPTVLSISKALYTFFTDYNIETRLAEGIEAYAAAGEASLGAEQKQIYEIYIEALDELVTAAGGDEVTADEFRQLLLTVVEEHDIGIIPTAIDEVMTGSIESIPLNAPKIAFVLGLSDGSFPKNAGEQSLFNDSDKLLLEKYDTELGRTDEQMLLYEQFLVFRAVSAPTEKLFLSYCAGSSGDSGASSAITEVMRVFPSLRYDSEDICDSIQNDASAFEAYAKYGSSALENYLKTTAYGQFMAIREETTLQKDTAAQLFGRNMRLSASRAAKFGECSFSYFCEYGMELKRRREKVLGALETGNYIHAVLENVIAEGLDRSEAEIRRSAEEYSVKYLRTVFGGSDLPAGFSAHYKRLVEKSVRLLMMFKEELAQSEFVPAAFEASISEGGDVNPVVIPLDGGSVRLVGVADRVDVYEKDGRKYVRIVDYKSGSREFDLQYVYYGLDIQMLMYLYAIRQNGTALFGQTVPAGCMYVGANPKTVKLEKDGNPADAAEEQLKKLPRSGIFLDNGDVLRAMDSGLDGRYIPVKEGGRSNPLITEEQFGKLFSHIKEILRDMGETLLNGRTEKNPIKTRDKDSCRYCVYAPYCFNDGKGRTLGNIDISNIFDKIDNGGAER